MAGMGKHSKQLASATYSLVRDNPVLPVIAGVGFAVSFQTIARLATEQHMPGWPVLYPILIDVFLLGVIVEARKAADDGRSDLAPRLVAWVLAGFTIYVNAHGSPGRDWLGIALHVAAPAAWITFLELTRWRKLRRQVSRRDRIPVARWILSPGTSAGMYRRMVLHNVNSYRVALAREEARMLALDLAAAVFGKRWKRDAPVVLRHQLRAGTLPDDVSRLCAMAEQGLAPALATPVEEWVTKAQRERVTAVARVRRETRAIEQGADSPPAATGSAPSDAPAKPRAARQNAVSANAAKRAKAERLLRANPALSRAEVVKRSGVSERTADRIRAQLPRQLHVAETGS
jgi:Protein of unknown function (DUF2637)